MKIMTGIDLHSNNAVCGLVDMKGKRILHKRVSCDLQEIVRTLAPYKKRIDTIAVEATFNWYWLVDGLQDHGYKVVLANPAKMEQYDGLKHADDTSDAFFVGDMLRLGILPCGNIYDRKTRPVRDLLRRRLGLVHKRSSLYISFKSMYTRMTGENMSLAQLKTLKPEESARLFKHPCDQLIAREQIELIERLTQSIDRIEEEVLKTASKMSCYRRLQSIPGIGKILGLTITMETGEAKRFPSPGDFASYGRCVRSQRISNNKKKGKNNDKCGNKYLAWAFVEAANFARRFDPQCRRFFDRKKAQANNILATKALACKLAKAAWHVMSHDQDFNPALAFGTGKKEKLLAEPSAEPGKVSGEKPSD